MLILDQVEAIIEEMGKGNDNSGVNGNKEED